MQKSIPQRGVFDRLLTKEQESLGKLGVCVCVARWARKGEQGKNEAAKSDTEAKKVKKGDGVTE